MMKKTVLYISAIALACACSIEPAAVSGPVFSAAIEQEGKTYVDAQFHLCWHAGDRVSIFDSAGSNAEYSFAGTDGDVSGRLERLSDGSAGDGPYTAVYPHSEANSVNFDGSVAATLQPVQSYASGSFGPGAGLMAARSETSSLGFRNTCGALVFRFYGSAGAVSSVTLEGNGGELLAGEAQIRWADGLPSVQILSGGSRSVRLDCNPPVSPGATADKAAEFWFALPPMTFEKGFTVTVASSDGGSCVFSSAKPLTVKRSSIKRMEALEVDFTPPTAAVEGQTLPHWQPGYLDIHGINGGRGEAFYYIFPDGTTMLVDAAGGPQSEYGYDSGIASKPSVAISCGQVIVNYIRHFAPVVAGGRLDYFMASHYHGDHIGAWRDKYSKFHWQPVNSSGTPVGTVNLAAGGFVVNGLPDVGMSIPIDKVIDRGDWGDRPSGDYLDENSQKLYLNYTNFLAWSAANHGTVREKLAIGHTDQIVLKHSPSKYSGFSVRGIAAGGDIWTGSGTGVNTSYVPSTAQCLANIDEWAINENIYSCVFHLSYGKFDWFSGGDIQFTGKSTYSWKDIELPISKVMKKVEAMKASHHSTKNTNSTELLGVLKPDVYVAGVWQDVQPNPATIKRVLAASPSVKIFTTNLAQSNVETLTGEGVNVGKFSATRGHVVLRILPGGEAFYVYVLDDSDLEYRVKAIFGPYLCK